MGPDARLEAFPGRRVERLLDHDGDPPDDERGNADDAPLAGPRLGPLEDSRRDQVGRDLGAGDQLTGGDHLAIEQAEDLDQVDPIQPLEQPDPDMDDATGRGQQVDPALGRTAPGEAPAGNGCRQSQRRVVLVDVAAVGHEHGQAGPAPFPVADHRCRVGRREGGQVRRAQPAALRPALARDLQIAGQDGAHQVGVRPVTWNELFDPHPFAGQPAAASAASIARLVWTTAIAARYSALALKSELTSWPSVAWAAAASIAAEPASLPINASSTAVAR